MQAKNPQILESCTKDRREWCKMSILLCHMYIIVYFQKYRWTLHMQKQFT